MDLILLRHGKAEDFSPGGDFTRELVEKGRQQSRRAAQVLAASDALPDIVLTSPLTRARQTADEFCQAANLPGPLIQDWLACGLTPDTAVSELVAFRDFKRVVIVGHEPDLSTVIQALVGAKGGSIVVKKGTLACLTVFPPSRDAALNFLIPPKLAQGWLTDGS